MWPPNSAAGRAAVVAPVVRPPVAGLGVGGNAAEGQRRGNGAGTEQVLDLEASSRVSWKEEGVM